MNIDQETAYRSDYNLYLRAYEGDRMAWTMASRKQAKHYLTVELNIQQPNRLRDITENLTKIPPQTEDGFIEYITNCFLIAAGNEMSVKMLPEKRLDVALPKSDGKYEALLSRLNEFQKTHDAIQAHVNRQQETLNFLQNQINDMQRGLSVPFLSTCDFCQKEIQGVGHHWEYYLPKFHDADTESTQEFLLCDACYAKETAKTDEVIKPMVIEPEPELTINAEWQAVLDELEHDTGHIFLTGTAGTGKSTLLGYWMAHSDKNIAVVAPSGVAALRVGGMTCHSFFGLPARALEDSEVNVLRDDKRARIEHLDVLVIDEISMVRADLMDAMEIALRKNRKSQKPFGGCRLVMVGDLYQLPPIAKSPEEKKFLMHHYASELPYFFAATCWRDSSFKMCELTTVYRQSDPEFVAALSAIRVGEVKPEHMALINACVKEHFVPPQGETWITLTPRNDEADKINRRMLEALKTEHKTFKATVNGEFRNLKTGEVKDAPTDEYLELAVGANVIFVRNDTQFHRYVNGTLGVVVSVSPLRVKTDNYEILVEEEKWEKTEYLWSAKDKKLTRSVTGEFIQKPLRLAAAITVHRSQGITLDNCIVNLGGGAFAEGQSFVALTRVRTRKGLVLTRPLRNSDLIVSKAAAAFMRGEPIAGQLSLLGDNS